MTSKEFFNFANKDWWTTNDIGEPLLKVENVKISHVGTEYRRCGRHAKSNSRESLKS